MLKINETKFNYKVKKIAFPVTHISGKGAWPSTEKIQACTSFKEPRTIEDIHSFLGLVDYVTRFIQMQLLKHFILRKYQYHKKYFGNVEQINAFRDLKGAITDKEVHGFFTVDAMLLLKSL